MKRRWPKGKRNAVDAYNKHQREWTRYKFRTFGRPIRVRFIRATRIQKKVRGTK